MTAVRRRHGLDDAYGPPIVTAERTPRPSPTRADAGPASALLAGEAEELVTAGEMNRGVAAAALPARGEQCIRPAT